MRVAKNSLLNRASYRNLRLMHSAPTPTLATGYASVACHEFPKNIRPPAHRAKSIFRSEQIIANGPRLEPSLEGCWREEFSTSS